jgi:hypothetical protein
VKLINQYSSTSEIRQWLNYFNVPYKNSERKASLVSKMEEVQNIFSNSNDKTGKTYSLLSPADILRLEQLKSFSQSITSQLESTAQYIKKANQDNQMLLQKTIKSIVTPHSVTDTEEDATETVVEENEKVTFDEVNPNLYDVHEKEHFEKKEKPLEGEVLEFGFAEDVPEMNVESEAVTEENDPETVEEGGAPTETVTAWYKEPSNIGIMLMILMFVISIALGLYLIF